MTRFDPSGPLRGALRPPADKSISHRAALIAAMGEGETTDRGLPRRRRHPLDPGRGRGARRRGRGERSAAEPDDSAAGAPRSAASACAAPRPAAIDVGNAGTLLRLLPGWLAGQDGGRLDARRRRLDPAPAGRPRRRAAARDGRRS